MRNWLFGILAMTLPAVLDAATLRQAISADMPQLMTLYRDLHANPELSMQEVETVKRLVAELEPLGYTVTGGSIRRDSARLDFDMPAAGADKDEIAARVNALPDDARVLDVGGWAAPLARADAVRFSI